VVSPRLRLHGHPYDARARADGKDHALTACNINVLRHQADAVLLLGRSRQTGEAHPTNVMHAPGDHPRAVRGDEPTQLGYRHVRAVLGYQAMSVQPAASVAAVARHIQHGKPRNDLAEGDDAERFNRLASPLWQR
jgi:hypothetical protein